MSNPEVIVLSGSMGAGKTTVMGEASDLLCARQIRHAAFDLDAVSIHMLPEPVARPMHFRNLAAVYDNCLAGGIEKFLIAVAVEDRTVLTDLTQSLKGARLTVCRLVAEGRTMADRLSVREPGIRRAEFLARSRTLDATLRQDALEDFTVSNDGRHITVVAQELLARVGWIPE